MTSKIYFHTASLKSKFYCSNNLHMFCVFNCCRYRRKNATINCKLSFTSKAILLHRGKFVCFEHFRLFDAWFVESARYNGRKHRQLVSLYLQLKHKIKITFKERHIFRFFLGQASRSKILMENLLKVLY